MSLRTGTAGGLVAHKETIIGDCPEGLFVINGDVCGDLPVDEMVNRIGSLPDDSCLLLTTEATREQSGNFGNVSEFPLLRYNFLVFFFWIYCYFLIEMHCKQARFLV